MKVWAKLISATLNISSVISLKFTVRATKPVQQNVVEETQKKSSSFNTYRTDRQAGTKIFIINIFLVFQKEFKKKIFLAMSELPIDGVSLGTYHVHRRDKHSHMYNNTCTFLHLNICFYVPKKTDKWPGNNNIMCRKWAPSSESWKHSWLMLMESDPGTESKN